MMLNRRVPFEGFDLSCTGNTLRYSLPWISLEARLDGPDKDSVLAGVEQLMKGDYFAPQAQGFLERLKEYPISYQAPRQHLAVDAARVSARTELPCRFPADILLQVGATHPMREWLWDFTRIQSIARLAEDAFDPVTIVSYLSGHRLELEALTDPYRRAIEHKLDRLRRTDEALMFELAALLIRQTHFITSNIIQSLALARLAHPCLAESTARFMDEERGHDKLMERSLAQLGHSSPADIPVLSSTSSLVRLFDLAARHSALAYTCGIGMFEGSFYSDSDPLADLLEKSSCPGAAYGYKTHFRINQEHNHKDEVFAFAAALPMLGRDELTLGVRMFELLARMSQLMDLEINHEIDRRIGQFLLR
jgi:hypothetical protein